MQPVPAIETDFIAAGELTIVHLPTGTRYSTYAASNPDEFYVLREGPADATSLCDRAKPILEEMLRRQRHVTAIEIRHYRGLGR
jgi:hypothetical protein